LEVDFGSVLERSDYLAVPGAALEVFVLRCELPFVKVGGANALRRQ